MKDKRIEGDVLIEEVTTPLIVEPKDKDIVFRSLVNSHSMYRKELDETRPEDPSRDKLVKLIAQCDRLIKEIETPYLEAYDRLRDKMSRIEV